MTVRLKRAYEPSDPDDGIRVLVDRVWPRGVSKEDLRIDRRESDIAPSNDLRKWFGHDPDKWSEFRRRYLDELADPSKQEILDDLAREARRGTVTLIFAARDTEHNQAVVLKEVLEGRASNGSG